MARFVINDEKTHTYKDQHVDHLGFYCFHIPDRKYMDTHTVSTPGTPCLFRL